MAAVPVPHAAHARMLEERPTGAAGAAIPLDRALELIESGQFVNVKIKGSAAADVPRAPVISLFDRRELDQRSEAEVLAIGGPQDDALPEVVLAVDSLPTGVAIGEEAVIDFTDVTGTYYLTGTIAALRSGNRAPVTIRLRKAHLIQLRRFVRVPVLITPTMLEVQAAPGEWRAVFGQIVDISLGGIGLLAAEPLFAEAHLRADFELPGRFGELSIHGRVASPPGPAEARTRTRPSQRAVYRRGVAFDPLAVDDLQRLQRSLYHRQVELRRLSDVGEAEMVRRPTVETSGDDTGVVRRLARPRWWFWGR